MARYIVTQTRTATIVADNEFDAMIVARQHFDHIGDPDQQPGHVVSTSKKIDIDQEIEIRTEKVR